MSETSSSSPVASPAASSRPTTQGTPHPAAAGGPQVQRQFVNFSFWKLDPAFRRLSTDQKNVAREEFLAAFNPRRDGLICLSYSTVSMRAECDFLLWRIGSTPDIFQEQTAAINKT